MTREEAISEIKAWDFLDNDEKKILETLIPELKESEDERIRKALIRFFQRFPYDRLNYENLKSEEAITWLEKQDETFTKKDVDNAYLKGISDAKNELDKQGEQKPVEWSEEDETGWTNTMIMIKEVASKHYTKDSIKLVIDWLKTLKQRIGG